MNVEIRRVANGYMVTPERCRRSGDYNVVYDDQIWVFRTYNDLTDKLFEIMEDMPDLKAPNTAKVQL